MELLGPQQSELRPLAGSPSTVVLMLLEYQHQMNEAVAVLCGLVRLLLSNNKQLQHSSDHFRVYIFSARTSF